MALNATINYNWMVWFYYSSLMMRNRFIRKSWRDNEMFLYFVNHFCLEKLFCGVWARSWSAVTAILQRSSTATSMRSLAEREVWKISLNTQIYPALCTGTHVTWPETGTSGGSNAMLHTYNIHLSTFPASSMWDGTLGTGSTGLDL